METKKKICIKTWYGTCNYGSNLQAIGLSKTLEKLGYDVYFLKNFRLISFAARHPVMLYARLYNVIHLRKRKQFFIPEDYEISSERKKRLDCFAQNFFKEKIYIKSDEWNKDIKARMIFACGSDILWNPAIGYPSTNFLDFAYYAKLPCFSYASSVGALELPRKYFRAYRRYLGSMKAVGVREQSVADMLEPIISNKPTKVVDPSLLLSISEWDELVNKAELSVSIEPRGFILCYFVMSDDRYWEYVKKAEKNTSLQVVVLPMHMQDEKQPYSIVLDGTPYEFLWLIKNAAFICTDSFHACVASMIYHKEFYLLRRTRKSEDAKFNDFLERYHLEDRSVLDETSFTRKKEIDYSYADKQLDKDKEYSLDFLRNALEECEK